MRRLPAVALAAFMAAFFMGGEARAQAVIQNPNLFFATPLSGTGFLRLRAIGQADLTGVTFPFTSLTGTETCGQLPALTGDIVSSGCATTYTGILGVPKGGTGDTTFTANQPLIGNGAGNIGQGARSGNTTTFATATGVLTNGHCVSIDASGNFVDAGGACSVGGGGGTVSSGTLNQLAYYAAAGTVVSGLATANNNILVTNGSGVPGWVAQSPCTNEPALTGDATSSAGSCATTLATVNGTVGTFGSANSIPAITVNAKGLITNIAGTTPAIPFTELTGITKSGNTTVLGTTSGTLTNGHCAQFDASGNVVDAGGACTTGGGASVVNAGTTNQLAFYAANGTAVSGLATANNGLLVTSGAGVPSIAATLPAVSFPALTGDLTTAGGALATTFATVNSNVGSFGGVNSIPSFTVNAKGLVTAASVNTPAIPFSELTGSATCAQVPAGTGDVTSAAGSCANSLVAISGTAVSGATGTAGSAVVLGTSPTISGLIVTGSLTATGLVTNADLVNTGTTVNGVLCTLGSSCTVSSTTWPLGGDTTSAVNPPTGDVGQEIVVGPTASGNLTTNTATTIASVSISAGHWLCFGTNQLNQTGGAAATSFQHSFSLSGNVDGNGANSVIEQAAQTSNSTVITAFGPARFNFTAPTTVFDVAHVNFPSGTISVTANFFCQRIW